MRRIVVAQRFVDEKRLQLLVIQRQALLDRSQVDGERCRDGAMTLRVSEKEFARYSDAEEEEIDAKMRLDVENVASRREAVRGRVIDVARADMG